MSIPDITNLSMAELSQLVTQATTAYRAAQQAEQVKAEQRREQIGQAISALESLLGPEDTAPYDPATGANATINGVLKHDTADHAVLAQNAGLALSLILRALKVDVGTGLNVAHVIANGEAR